MAENKYNYLKVFNKVASIALLNQARNSDVIPSIVRNYSQDDVSKAKKLLSLKSPFIYLTSKEKDELIQGSTIEIYSGLHQKILKPDEDGSFDCIFLLEGNLILIDKKSSTSEVLEAGDSFGFDACIFGEIDYDAFSASNECKVMKIKSETVKSLLIPDKQFTMMIGSNLLNKQRIFAPIENFRNYIADCVETGEINIAKLLKVYKAIESSLHPNRKSKNIDFNAWKYAVCRLPENLCDTFVYFISTTLPDMFNDAKILVNIKSPARQRIIYCLMPGKNYIIMRELMTDINDFLANLCIHIIESKKLRAKLRDYSILSNLLETQDISVLPLDDDEKDGLVKVWGSKVVDSVKNLILHHEDYRISIYIPFCHLKMSPIEKWTENLWKGCLEALETEMSVVEAINKGLVVDFMQGSTRTILNAVSPYIYQNSATIEAWFKKSGLELETKDFTDPRDILNAMAYYYLKQHPAELEKRKKIERESGIIVLEETFNTGVRAIIININKLSKIVPGFCPKGKYHLLVFIGFTFGKQSYYLVNNINLLFGKSIISYAVMGKAGGLVGSREDILIATSFFDEVSKNVIRTNPAGISSSLLQKETDSIVRIGPMLTVSGTILQNRKLLLYYKLIQGCVGLEMEGAYIALCIQHCKEAGIIKDDVTTRFIYYVSDIPLNPTTTLASEDDNVNWNEGVKSINGILRYVLGLVSCKTGQEVNSEIAAQISKLVAKDKVCVVATSTDAFNIFNHNAASKIAEEVLELGYTVVYLHPQNAIKPFMTRISQEYIESSGFFPDAVEADMKKHVGFKNSGELIMVEYSSQVDYISKLHFLAESLAGMNRSFPFLFTDVTTAEEVISNLYGSEVLKVKTYYENLKINCPKAFLVLFRTDLENGAIGQSNLLNSYRFNYVFTRYRESNHVDVVSEKGKESIASDSISILSKFLLKVTNLA